MYKNLKRRVLDEGSLIILFQETRQLARSINVKNFIIGPSSGVVYYNLKTVKFVCSNGLPRIRWQFPALSYISHILCAIASIRKCHCTIAVPLVESSASDLLLEAPKLKRSKARGPGIFQQQPACAMSYLGWLSVKQFSFFTIQGEKGYAHVLIWSNSELRLF